MGSDVFNNYTIPLNGLLEDAGSGTLSGSTVTITDVSLATLGWSLNGTVSAIGGTLTLSSLLGLLNYTFTVDGDGPNYIVGRVSGLGDQEYVFSDQPVSSGSTYNTGSGTGNFNPQTACFAAGSRILTQAGEVAVEALTQGTNVVLADGRREPIVWVGRRRVDCARHPRPWDVEPVRVCANAFGAGEPHDDLLLSPDHAVLFDGALMPIRYLLNGRTIRQEARRQIVYYHVELPTHGILLAQGLQAESYLDTGNRAAFENAERPRPLHPEATAREAARAVWTERACAPLVTDGPRLVAARERLIAHALRRGDRLTDDPALCLDIGGVALAPEIDGNAWRWRLPSGTRSARLRSRAFVPAETTPESNDRRRLGVAVSALSRDGVPLDLAHPALGGGWNESEPTRRWTSGCAEIALEGATTLEIVVDLTGRYWVDADPPTRLAVAA